VTVPGPVAIEGEVIRLGQFLQVAGVADTGSDAKVLLADGEVSVNGVAECRRGRQLHSGDVVVFGDVAFEVVGPGER